MALQIYKAEIRMKPMQFLTTITLILILISVSCQKVTLAQKMTLDNKPLAIQKSASRLMIEPSEYNFGLIDEGIEVSHDFSLTNKSQQVINIYNAYATCGCTVPKLLKHSLKPNETTILKITVDTTMKLGNITKSVFIVTNDTKNPKQEIKLIMNVKDPHKGLSKEKMAKIFTSEKCTSCHVARGIGLFGRDLYNADCAMCHGPKAEGAVGPKLIGPYYDKNYYTNITKVASFGSPSHPSMPGFLSDAGGPLNKDQIDSIVKYLSDLSKLRNYK